MEFVYGLMAGTVLVAVFITGAYFGSRQRIVFIQENQKMFSSEPSKIPPAPSEKGSPQIDVPDEEASYLTPSVEKALENARSNLFMKQLSEIDTDV